MLIGPVRDLDLDVIVKPGRLRPINRGDEFLGKRGVKLIDLDGGREVASAERRDVDVHCCGVMRELAVRYPAG
jgi:hypothetical protein